MKSVFYKSLLIDKIGLSAGERIVYSNLAYNAICGYEETWDKETGKYDAINLSDEYEIPIYDTMTSNTIESINPISRVTAWRAIKKLVSVNIIDENREHIRLNNIMANGYFTLQIESGLKNELLIFYSWLVDLAKDTKIIYCNREKLCQLYHSDMNDMKYYLKRLNQLGFVKRNEKNNLIVV